MARNVVIMSNAATQPERLLLMLGRHPDIAVPPCPPISRLLHATSNGLLRGMPRGRSAVVQATADARTIDAVELARMASGSTLRHMFDQLRRSTGREIVVVWDPDGLTYPLPSPVDFDVVMLLVDPWVAARRITAGIHADIAAAAIAERIAGVRARVASWGVGPERVHDVDELRLADGGGLTALLEFLGVEATATTIQRMLAPHAGATSASARPIS